MEPLHGAQSEMRKRKKRSTEQGRQAGDERGEQGRKAEAAQRPVLLWWRHLIIKAETSGHRSQTATRSWEWGWSTDQGCLWELQSEENTCTAASALEKETSEAREAGRDAFQVTAE